MSKVSLIIPTLNAESYMPALIEVINKQTVKPHEIIVVDSESDDNTVQMAQEAGWKLLHVKRADFDHGGTRNYAFDNTTGDFVLFLSQDALPTNEYYIEELIKGFEDEDVAMISARQVARKDATEIEKLIRNFNYPERSFTRTEDDIATMGIKAYFFSDVCSAYRRTAFETLGKFESPLLTNEDMLMVARALDAGYKVGYCGTAEVYHSHNYTLKQQYKRNFDISAFMTMYSNEIQSGSSVGEGIKMVLYIEKELLKKFRLFSMVWCVLDSGAKFLGNRRGKGYKSMSKEQILKNTSNKAYWNKYYVY